MAIGKHTAESLGVTRYRVDLFGDATGNPNCYLYALRLMEDENNHPVLIHCGAGTERTGVAIVLHRMLREDQSRDDAMAEAIAAGHDPDRNTRFSPTLDEILPQIRRALEAGDWVTGAEPLTPAQLSPTTRPEREDTP